MKKQICHLSLEYPQGTNKNKTDQDQAIFSAPEGWVIKSYIFKHLKDLGPTSHNISWVPANSNFVSNQELSTSYDNATSAAATLGFKGEQLAELKADLNVSYSEFQQYANVISASHQTLIHKAKIRGAGAFNGRTKYEGFIMAEVEEMPSAMRNAVSVNQFFAKIIDDFKSENPIDPDSSSDNIELGKDSIPTIIQAGSSKFVINKFDQLVRVFWDNNWQSKVVPSETPLQLNSLAYSESHNALYALTDDNNIFIVREENGNWLSEIIPTYGEQILPGSLTPLRDQIGVSGINLSGHYVTTWHDSTNGTEIPGGDKLSFAVIFETQNLV